MNSFVRKALSTRRTFKKGIKLIPYISIWSLPAFVLMVTVFAIYRSITLPYKGLPIRVRLFGNEALFKIRGFYDLITLYEVFAERQYDISVAQDPEIIIDLGSNTGASIIFFKLKYPQAMLYGYEPNPTAFQWLKENVKQFNNDVVICQKMVADRSGILDFYSHHKSISSSVFDRGNNAIRIRVPAITLDSIAQDLSVQQQRVTLIKFDIEGAEFNVFQAARCADQFTYFVGEFHHDIVKNGTEEEFFYFFSDYDVYSKKITPFRSVVWGSKKA